MRVPEKSEFRAYIDRVRLSDQDFNTDVFKPGTAGEATLFSALKQSLTPDRPLQSELLDTKTPEE